MIAAQGLNVDWSSSGEKIVLHIICFAYSLSFLLSLVFLVFFLCCIIKLSLSPAMSFPFCPFLLHIKLGGGKGKGKQMAV